MRKLTLKIGMVAGIAAISLFALTTNLYGDNLLDANLKAMGPGVIETPCVLCVEEEPCVCVYWELLEDPEGGYILALAEREGMRSKQPEAQ